MTKRKYNPIANLIGFMNLSNKKRKTGKKGNSKGKGMSQDRKQSKGKENEVSIS